MDFSKFMTFPLERLSPEEQKAFEFKALSCDDNDNPPIRHVAKETGYAEKQQKN